MIDHAVCVGVGGALGRPAGGGLTPFPSSVTAVGVGVATSPGLSGCSQLVPICGQWELSSQRISHPSPQLSLGPLEGLHRNAGGKARRARCRRAFEKKLCQGGERSSAGAGADSGNGTCQLTSAN